MVKAEYINPFIEAAFTVLKTELGCEGERGAIALGEGAMQTEDVTVSIGVTGQIEGTVFYAMRLETALRMVSAMMGEPVKALDALTESALGEMANVITGLASTSLANAGYTCDIAPPMVLKGKSLRISTLNIPRIIVPIVTPKGTMTIHVALSSGIE